MIEWNRTDYDKLDAEGRWPAPVTVGIPRWLAFHLLLSAVLLLAWSPMF